ncbi:MAG TPA: hypothetical protein VFH73_16095 [Polyangia bacterium]|jgi:hypothetical protein|nr:hypothetical protein [Polyangia bacterium]
MQAPVFAARLCLVVALAAGCSSVVANVKPEAHALAPNVTMVIALPPVLEFRRSGEQGRVGRRLGDALLAATGGNAIVPEELDDAEGPAVANVVRALGADLAHAITFRIVASRAPRAEATPAPIPGVRSPVHFVLDYTVRVEVGRPGRDDLLGTVETQAVASPDDPEMGPDGESLGLQSAVDEAIAGAIGQFAPSLRSSSAPLRVIEAPGAPPGKTLSVSQRLSALTMLYPEYPAEFLRKLAGSDARFLVLSPGALQRVGVSAGDLLGASRGTVLASRAVLARKLAGGVVPAMYAERAGDRFLISQTTLTRQ